MRMMENCDKTHVLVSFYNLLAEHRDNYEQPKVASLISKCLIKLSKNMAILKHQIDISKLLVAMHGYICVLPAQKTITDDGNLRVAKGIVNELTQFE